MLVLKNISKQYEGSKNKTLNNINLNFESKGLVSILGPSGCGKTTLLNLIGGLDKPSSGSIIVDDKILNNFKRKTLNRYHNNYVGFIYQNYNLINYLNVVDNIELINKNNHIKELLEYLHLYDKRKKKIKNLSGGERQRVAIARSLSNNPKILLCDEPTGALDTKNSHEIMKLLKNISKSILVIMVTHNKELAEEYSDRIITIEDGKVMSDTKIIKKVKQENYSISKIKISKMKILNIILNNLKNKYKRNILSIIAFSIGLISLALVLGISIGFDASIEKEEKESLSKYPIFISETSTNLSDSISRIFETTEQKEDNYIYANEGEHKNVITESYLNDLNKIDNYLDYKISMYLVDGKQLTISNKRIEELKLLEGKDIERKNEVILITKNRQIDSAILLSLGLKEDKYRSEELINHEFKIKSEKYSIVGIATFNEDSYLTDISGLLMYDYVTNDIPLAISLYPKNYESKINLLKHLNNYPDIEYTDYSSTIKSLSKTILDGITIVLISFSTISLFVSTIMIGIISYISVVERIKEIGIFKSLGMSDRYIEIIFIGENIILGIISSLFSFAICKLASIPINNLLTNISGMSDILLINLNSLSILLIISISLCIIGSYFPIRKTKKLKIVDCLKYE